MSLTELKCKQLVQFPVRLDENGKPIYGYGQVVQVKADGSAVILDGRGGLHDERPEHCDPAPRAMHWRLLKVTDRMARSAKFRRAMRAHADRTYRRRLPVRMKQPPGTYGTPWKPVGFNSFRTYDDEGNEVDPPSFKGHLEVENRDIPYVMAEALTSDPRNYLLRLIAYGTAHGFSYSNVKRMQIEQALLKLEPRYPLRVETFRRVYFGGIPWMDEFGRWVRTPMAPADVAKVRGVSVQAVSQSLAQTEAQLEQMLGWKNIKRWRRRR